MRSKMNRPVLLGLLLGAGLSFYASAALGATWTVEQDGSGDFETIQEAVEAASPGDLVLVGPGTYRDLHLDSRGERTIVELKSGVEIRSASGPDATTLDAAAEGERRAVSAYRVDAGAVLSGFTIRGGDALLGGGIYLYESDARILENRVRDNLAGAGAGIVSDGFSFPRIEANEVIDNVACCGEGGGILCTGGSYAEVIGNIVRGNEGFGGGGIGISQAGEPLVAENLVAGNVGLAGGGIAVIASRARVERNRVLDNDAQQGGGIVSWSGGGSTFTRNVVARNRAVGDGGGYHISADSPQLLHETIVGNSSFLGSGIFSWNHSAARIEGCIVAFNLDGEGIYADDPGSVPTVRCCDVFGHGLGDYGGFLDDLTGTGFNLSIDPLFCDREAGDYRLAAGSPLRLLVDASGAGCGVRGALEEPCVEPALFGAGEDTADAAGWIAFPNPSAGTVRLLRTGPPGTETPTRIDVVDVAGRRVRSLRSSAGPPAWDATDERGRPVPNGFYYLFLHDPPAGPVALVLVRR